VSPKGGLNEESSLRRVIQGNKEAMGRRSSKVLVEMESEEIRGVGEKVEKGKETNKKKSS
jgi:hypothetical protein